MPDFIFPAGRAFANKASHLIPLIPESRFRQYQTIKQKQELSHGQH